MEFFVPNSTRFMKGLVNHKCSKLERQSSFLIYLQDDSCLSKAGWNGMWWDLKKNFLYTAKTVS